MQGNELRCDFCKRPESKVPFRALYTRGGQSICFACAQDAVHSMAARMLGDPAESVVLLVEEGIAN